MINALTSLFFVRNKLNDILTKKNCKLLDFNSIVPMVEYLANRRLGHNMNDCLIK